MIYLLYIYIYYIWKILYYADTFNLHSPYGLKWNANALNTSRSMTRVWLLLLIITSQCSLINWKWKDCDFLECLQSSLPIIDYGSICNVIVLQVYKLYWIENNAIFINVCNTSLLHSTFLILLFFFQCTLNKLIF